MRFKLSVPFLALSILLAALFPAAPAAAQLEPNAENAITCALIYSFLGDTGPAYDGLVAKAAALGGRSIDAVRTDLAARGPRLAAAAADGRIDPASLVSPASNGCPQSFGVAPAIRRAASAAVAAPARPDPYQCAGLFRWLDARYPSNTWGTTWAGDEMVRRAASAAGVDYDTMDRRAGGFAPDTSEPGPLLDRAVQCQAGYDTPVPPGAVIAAAEHGDRPGIERGRNSYCKALSNDFDKRFPDVASVEAAIARNPQFGMNRTLAVMKELQWPLDAMGKAGCPAAFGEPRVAAFEDFTTRATAAAKSAKQRLEREGQWW